MTDTIPAPPPSGAVKPLSCREQYDARIAQAEANGENVAAVKLGLMGWTSVPHDHGEDGSA